MHAAAAAAASLLHANAQHCSPHSERTRPSRACGAAEQLSCSQLSSAQLSFVVVCMAPRVTRSARHVGTVYSRYCRSSSLALLRRIASTRDPCRLSSSVVVFLVRCAVRLSPPHRCRSMSGAGAGQYHNTTLVGNWYEDRLHRSEAAHGEQVRPTQQPSTLGCHTVHCTAPCHTRLRQTGRASSTHSLAALVARVLVSSTTSIATVPRPSPWSRPLAVRPHPVPAPTRASSMAASNSSSRSRLRRSQTRRACTPPSSDPPASTCSAHSSCSGWPYCSASPASTWTSSSRHSTRGTHCSAWAALYGSLLEWLSDRLTWSALCCSVCLCGSPLSLSSHCAYGGQFADSAEGRRLLPLVDWEEKEAMAAAEHSRAQRGSGAGIAAITGSHTAGSTQRAAGKQCSGASGERLRVGGAVDPAVHSFVQRSWLPDREHFDHYCAERVDVWNTNAEMDRRRDESNRLARRTVTAATVGTLRDTEKLGHNKPLSTATSRDDGRACFDRSVHAFTTAPAFEPLP